jgi:hypothetical protein
MKLQEAKKAAVSESKAQPRKMVFVEVDAKGDCDITTHFKADSCLHAYKNGSEVALPVAPTVSKKGIKNNSNTEEMATTKSTPAKKTAPVSTKKVEQKSNGSARSFPLLNNLTDKQYEALMKKGDNPREIVAKGLIAYYKL